jgi:hypothetical protein
MRLHAPERRFALRVLAGSILVLGLCAAVWIYKVAEQEARAALSNEEDASSLYLRHPEYTKKYVRELELYGGKANVLADRFARWVASLGEGKNLAFLVAGVSIALALLCLAGAKSASSRPTHARPDARRKDGEGQGGG